jgi:trimeric autotransporter adhesin
MKKQLLFIICLACSFVVFSQEKMYIHKSNKVTLGAMISKTDSLFFNITGTEAWFSINGSLVQYPVAEIDSVTFGENSDTIKITYNGNSVSVFNPFAFEGVSIALNGSDVTVNSTSQLSDINYKLQGSTTDGMFKIYSERKFNLHLNGVSVTNTDGPAINIQSGKKVTVILANGTTNSFTDGITYLTGEEDQKSAFFSEGQLNFEGTGSLIVKSNSKHAICSDDYINISNGTINITGAAKDGIHSKDYFKMSGGTLTVSSTGDGIECEKGFIDISGGSITTNNPALNVRGIACDSILTISGGTINMTVGGNQSKGIKSGKLMTLSGGTITINTSGGVVLEASGSGFNPAFCSAIKGDSSIVLSGSNIIVKSTGQGGKGITSNADITVTSGNVQITTTGGGSTYKNSGGVTDSYNATCISTDGNILIIGGTVTNSSSGTGGKGITTDGNLKIGGTDSTPSVNVTTTGARFLVSGSGQNANYAEAKAVKSDGVVTVNSGNITISSADDGIKSKTSITVYNGNLAIVKSVEALEGPFITVNNGDVNLVSSDDGFNATKGNGGEGNDGSCLYFYGGRSVVNSSNGDPIDSNGNIVMTGGTVIAHGPQSQPEVGIDVNGTFNISGGFLIVSGTNSNMTEGTSTTSSQYSVIAKSSASNSNLFHIQDTSGKALVTFKPVRNYYSMVFSSSDLKSGSTYSIYTGGNCTGALNDGLYIGGTYSGGTLKKSFTVTSKVMNVTF